MGRKVAIGEDAQPSTCQHCLFEITWGSYVHMIREQRTLACRSPITASLFATNYYNKCLVSLALLQNYQL